MDAEVLALSESTSPSSPSTSHSLRELLLPKNERNNSNNNTSGGEYVMLEEGNGGGMAAAVAVLLAAESAAGSSSISSSLPWNTASSNNNNNGTEDCVVECGPSSGTSSTSPTSSNNAALLLGRRDSFSISNSSTSSLPPLSLSELFSLATNGSVALHHVFLALTAWYLFGVLSIVTTKVLLQEWGIPPLLLTFQQLLLGSTMLRMYLAITPHGIEPWPWNVKNESATTAKDFALVGLFNALDFLASNTAFSRSDASFVETIKASDPITTSMVALFWGVDRVGQGEAMMLFLLIAGMLLSTVGNAQTSQDISFQESASTAATVVTANVCFAFRAMSQKLYRRQATCPTMDDASLLCRMQQIGWCMLLLPAFFCYTTEVVDAIVEPSLETQFSYMQFALLNAFGFVTYK